MNPTTTEAPAAPPVSAVTRLNHLGVILVTGADARGYLQGQITADIERLRPDQIQLACCNSPQGRVQAVFWLLERADGIALILPASMLDATVARLRKYVLRAKVKIDIAAHLQVGFLSQAPDLTFPVNYFQLPGLDIPMALGDFSSAPADAERELAWKRAYVNAGLPFVYPETHEAFVAQMLNIDTLGGISFDKGCYTGQEIVARAHFRGTVKRRMFLFRSSSGTPLPGTRVLAGDQHAGEVVDAVGTDVLAVVSLQQLKNELRLDGQEATLTRQALPYSVGED